ncbi:hypothetical protein JMUB7528_28500 [Staphylococcus aureus]
MIRRPPRSTQGVSSAASDVYKRQLVEDYHLKYKTSKNFINKVYKGGFNSLVLNFVEKEDLSQDEIEELRLSLIHI